MDTVFNAIHRFYVRYWYVITGWWIVNVVLCFWQVNTIFAIVAAGQGGVMIVFALFGKALPQLLTPQPYFPRIPDSLMPLMRIQVALMRVAGTTIGYGGLILLPVIHMLMAFGGIEGREEFLNP